MKIIKKVATAINKSENKIIYLDNEFIKLESVFGVIANIRLIIFLGQNQLAKVKRPNLIKNMQQKINTS